MRDLRLAFRTLLKSPFVTAVAILSLGLGIGANTAIFSMFEQLLLRPLPVPESGRLVNLQAPGPNPGSQSCNMSGGCDEVFSYPMYRDLEASPGSPLVGLAAHRLFSANVAYQGSTLNGEGVYVSGSYFPLLGIRPARGRLFTPADDQTFGAHPVVVLSYRFWQSRLGGAADVLGRTLVVNGQPLTIVGIGPERFEGTTLGPRPLVFVPITMRKALSPSFDGYENRRNYWIYGFGRLKPGATLEQAQSAINATYHRLINEVDAPLQEGMSEQTMAAFRAKQIVLADGRKGQSSIHDEARMPLIMLFATAAMVLLIACANIANLLLARGATRDLEMAVRLSLGASRTRVLAQLLTESVVLALLGGVASLLFAKWTLDGIVAMMPAEAADMMEVRLRPAVVAFAAALAIGTGLLFGLFPALHSTRTDLVTTIRSSAANLTVTRAAARFRTALVTVQVALSMTLLIAAGLFVKSLANVSRVELGVKTNDVVTFGVSPVLNGYEPERSRVFFDRLEQELAALPGVVSVTSARVPLLAGDNWGNSVSVQGFEKNPDTDDGSRFNAVSPAYFSTLGVPLLAGREFEGGDLAAAGKVAVVNEAFAKKFGLGREAVGKWMSEGGDDELDIQIVGLVKDAKYSDVKDEVPPQYFRPWRQQEDVGGLNFYVRTDGNVAALLRAIPGVVKQLDPNLPVEQLKSLPQQVKENVFIDRMISTMSAAFALLATLLAAVGLYGVVAYTMARRTREVGVRMALGASAGRVQRMVLRQVGVMVLIGGAIGMLAAWQLARAASSMLYGLKSWDPLVLVLAAAVLALAALAAGYFPARRAAAIDPARALHQD